MKKLIVITLLLLPSTAMIYLYGAANLLNVTTANAVEQSASSVTGTPGILPAQAPPMVQGLVMSPPAPGDPDRPPGPGGGQ